MLAEKPAARLPDQAPLIRGDRTVEKAQALRSSAAENPASGLKAALEPASRVELDMRLAPSTTSTSPTQIVAEDERQKARAAVRPGFEREPPAHEAVDDQDQAEPETAAPTLSTAEVELLERARRLAKRGEHQAALASLREHARAHPSSVLAPERAAEEVAVLCRMGADSATMARASFLASDPPQYLRSRVEKACTP
jgi:hypothetical protein